ncbi:hypothetical protein VSS37_03455 [Candidatus Thiothrix sp. Deng01]|uniref:Tail assembly chaperone n=1 Tax=Candidatus Thiothrix phosphatis TaxID=3112415 RepID=A0ABU6CU39_9GAMM|nr:hypothetical protein [Candidatus Thiothrix sp. Deng01]MEB4590027.1 hypothetical protein [Candidatus Thiothrix sp. Deng01]
MAIVLKGSQPEIKIKLTATMPDCSDSFTAVYKRGTKDDLKIEFEKANAGKLKDEEFLKKWLIRVEDLIDAETGEYGKYDADEILPVMIPHVPYMKALVKGAWTAIGNYAEHENQRLGN